MVGIVHPNLDGWRFPISVVLKLEKTGWGVMLSQLLEAKVNPESDIQQSYKMWTNDTKVTFSQCKIWNMYVVLLYPTP